jgi:ankyrin repeat protein
MTEPGARTQPSDDVVGLATRLFTMARAGQAAILAEYLAAGVPANLANDSGDTLIMLAAYHGHADTVRALLDAGADPNRLNDKGQTPIAGAVFKGETDVVRTLLAGGADPTTGRPSAVDAATLFGQTDLVALFATTEPSTD